MQIYEFGFQPLPRRKIHRTMTHSNLEQENSKQTEKADFELIKGDFTAEEGMEILNYLIDKKISFHQLKRFGADIRFGDADEFSATRSKELKETKTSMNKFLEMAKEQGSTLRLRSSLSIEII